MQKIILLVSFLFCAIFSFAQFPNNSTTGNASTLYHDRGGRTADGGFVNTRFADTTTANTYPIAGQPGAQIIVGNTVYVRDSTATRWILNGSTGSAINNGLLSIGGIILVDSTVTLRSNIVWSIDGSTFTRTTDTSFIVHTADSGYYRRDLIYADNTGVIHITEGEPDTLYGVLPALTSNSILVTTIDVYGNSINKPYPNVIGKIPTWHQTLLENDTTTEAPIIVNNTQQATMQILGNANRSYYWLERNLSNGAWANVGVLLKNDFLPSNTFDEHSGHFLQMYMGGTNSAFSTDGGLIRSNGLGGIKVALDSGTYKLGTGSPSTGNYVKRFEMGTDGNLSFYNYKNNASEDSILTSDINGRLKFKLGGYSKAQTDSIAALKLNTSDTTDKWIPKGTYFPIGVHKPIIAIDSFDIGLDSFNLKELRYSLAQRDTTNWTDTTLIDKKFFLDRLASYTPGGVTWGSIIGTLSDQTDLQSALDAKQATLVSGTNIKTINGNSLLGSGDLTISGGGTSSGVDSTNTATSAGQTVFTFPYTFTDYTVSKQVTRNGVLIDPSDYSLSGSDITFTGFTCDSGDKIRFIGVK